MAIGSFNIVTLVFVRRISFHARITIQKRRQPFTIKSERGETRRINCNEDVPILHRASRGLTAVKPIQTSSPTGKRERSKQIPAVLFDAHMVR